jgi:hypothetical protein
MSYFRIFEPGGRCRAGYWRVHALWGGQAGPSTSKRLFQIIGAYARARVELIGNTRLEVLEVLATACGQHGTFQNSPVQIRG